MAAITAPGRTAAQHQSLLILSAKEVGRRAGVGQGARDGVAADRAHGRSRPGSSTTRAFPSRDGIRLGYRTNTADSWQAGELPDGVSLSLANHAASLRWPIGCICEGRAEDDVRRAKTGVPERSRFKTKPETALDQIRWACEAGLPGNMVLMDAGYGHEVQAAQRHR